MTSITDKEKQEALDWLDEQFLDEQQSDLEDIFGIGVPPGTDYSEIYKALGFIKTIRAALSQTPEGFVMVPIDPTEKMFNAFVDVVNSDAEITGTGSFQLAYAALIHAAPKPTEKTDD